jgi:hypothetical protein
MFQSTSPRNLFYSGTPERCFTWAGSSLLRKHLTWPERLNRNKRSSLLQKNFNYCRKKFHNVGTSSSSVSFQSIQRAMPEIMDTTSVNNSRIGCKRAMRFCCYEAKRPSLKLIAWYKQLLSSLLSALTLSVYLRAPLWKHKFPQVSDFHGMFFSPLEQKC